MQIRLAEILPRHAQRLAEILQANLKIDGGLPSSDLRSLVAYYIRSGGFPVRHVWADMVAPCRSAWDVPIELVFGDPSQLRQPMLFTDYARERRLRDLEVIELIRKGEYPAFYPKATGTLI